MDDPARMMQALATLFRKDADIPEEKIHAVEGALEQGKLSLKVLMVTDDFVLLRAWRGKGLIDPSHQHNDHESVATLLSGRLKMRISPWQFGTPRRVVRCWACVSPEVIWPRGR